MACTENQCLRCDWYEFENRVRRRCPQCGGRVKAFFDEGSDHFEREDLDMEDVDVETIAMEVE